MKVFISQPMNGKTNEQIEKERAHLIDVVRGIYKGEQIEVIESFFKDAPHEAKPLWFLGKALELLSTADVAVFAKDWQDARGCRIENACCEEYGIEYIESYSEIDS